MFNFRSALMQAAIQAFKEGQITRAELFTIRVASLSPKVLRKIELACVEQLKEEGVIDKGLLPEEINWEEIIKWIIEILPIILQLIMLFL